MVNKKLIKMRMLELDLTNSDVCKALDIAESTWSMKMNGERAIKVWEMFELQKILKLEDNQLNDFFYN